jgi:hypothetical protein
MVEAAEHRIKLKMHTEPNSKDQTKSNCYRVGQVLERDWLVHYLPRGLGKAMALKTLSVASLAHR